MSVYLVGAGPGDPDLMTVRGMRLLRRAEVVVYDRLVSPELLAEVPEDAELIYAGKEPGRHSCPQEEIHDILIRHALEGKVVVRLKGGDPFLFGRGAEEVLACAEAGVSCEVVPGVTSALSVPALAGIPVTHRGIAASFMVVTGHCDGRDRVDWQAAARVDTLVILMGHTRLGEIAERLVESGRAPSTPAAAISRGSLPGERVVTASLSDIAERAAGLASPVLVVVGEVVRLRERLCQDTGSVPWRDSTERRPHAYPPSLPGRARARRLRRTG
ncbi:MAG: uroporphyrin-III C-methyltransferase [Acidobacteriota bacterium]|nr:uroporphyrin-III C-methyltransferase [Acidobacteriota bacterium]